LKTTENDQNKPDAREGIVLKGTEMPKIPPQIAKVSTGGLVFSKRPESLAMLKDKVLIKREKPREIGRSTPFL